MVIKYVSKNDTLLFYFPSLSPLFSFGFLAGERVSHLLPTVECGPPAPIPYLRFSWMQEPLCRTLQCGC